MKTQYYKLLAVSSLALFLFTVLKIESIILLCLTGCFTYAYLAKKLGSLTEKDFIHLLPKKMKKHIEQKSFADYVSTLQIVKTTPILNYFVPFLKAMSTQKRNQLETQNYPKTTSAITLGNNQFLDQTSTKKTCLKMVRQPLFSQQNLSEQILQQTLKFGLKNSAPQHLETHIKQVLAKEEPATFTTCQSTNDFNIVGMKRPHSNIGKRKSSLMIRRKFAEESSSNEQPLHKKDLQRKIHRSNSQNKISHNNTEHILPIAHKEFSNRGSVQPYVANPLKTLEEYVKALIWMMKRLLGLRKMTSKVRRASTLSVASAAALFWLMVYLQIKMDKRKGQLIFKTLKALIGTLLVLSAAGTTSMLGYKLYTRLTSGEEPPKRPQQYLIYDKK